MKGTRGIKWGEQYWWECPECGEFFMEEREADMCYMMDTWPEDAQFHMRYGLVPLEVWPPLVKETEK